jgi:hypothetical protein
VVITMGLILSSMYRPSNISITKLMKWIIVTST